MVDARAIELLIVLHFCRSGDFNGLPLTAVLKVYPDVTATTAAIIESLERNRVSCAFGSVSVNPHIKRVRDLPVEQQIELTSRSPAEGFAYIPPLNSFGNT